MLLMSSITWEQTSVLEAGTRKSLAHLDRSDFSRGVAIKVGLDGVQERREVRGASYRDFKSSVKKGNRIELVAEERLGSREFL